MNIVQIQSRVQEMPNSAQTMQYLNAAMNGQVTTVPPYIAAAELKRRETEGMMDQLSKGAAQAQQATVKDQLQQKMGIMALMGQQQPPQPPQIPQPAPPEQQPQAGGIDSLPIRDDMFTAAGGGIVAFSGEKGSVVPEPYETPYDRMIRLNREEAAQRGTAPGGQPEREPGESLDAYRQRLRAFGEPYAQQRNERRRIYEQSEEAQQRGIAERGSAFIPREKAAAPTAGTPEVSNAYPDETRRGAAAGLMSMAARPPAPPPGTLRTAPPPGAGGQRPPAPQNAGPAAAPQAAQGIQKLLENSPEFQRMMKGVNDKNPYAEKQESQSDYIKRMTEGIRSQMPGGQMPYETSEARLKEIEGRRAKEDTEYADSNKGRQLDNLLTMISGMGRGSFGNAGAQGIQAVQKVERSQREEDLRRKDLRDQQSMKLMEIRSLNEQAQMALAQGNVQAYEKLTQEAKKLKIDFDKDQAVLAKGAATLRTGAAKEDLESADKAKERANRLAAARLGADARAAGAESKEIAAAEAAFARDPEAAAIKKRLEVPYGAKEAKANDLARLRQIQADKYAQFGIKLEGAPGAQGPSGSTPPPGAVREIKK
jgi:hypothetical protein